MRFRAVCSFNAPGLQSPVRLVSSALATEAEATELMQAMLHLVGVGSVDMETELPGLGWIAGGTVEAESVQIMCRLQEK